MRLVSCSECNKTVESKFTVTKGHLRLCRDCRKKSQTYNQDFTKRLKTEQNTDLFNKKAW